MEHGFGHIHQLEALVIESIKQMSSIAASPLNEGANFTSRRACGVLWQCGTQSTRCVAIAGHLCEALVRFFGTKVHASSPPQRLSWGEVVGFTRVTQASP